MQEKKIEFFHFLNIYIIIIYYIIKYIGWAEPILARQGLGQSQPDEDLGQSWPKKGWDKSFFLFFSFF
jgi:hypothetical protein